MLLYYRLTPTYAIIIGVLATLTPYFGNGPNWYFNDNHTKYCQKNWWHNILYINTLVTYNAGEGDATVIIAFTLAVITSENYFHICFSVMENRGIWQMT